MQSRRILVLVAAAVATLSIAAFSAADRPMAGERPGITVGVTKLPPDKPATGQVAVGVTKLAS